MFKVGDVVEITAESDATGMLEFKSGKGYVVQDFRVSEAGVWWEQVYLCGEGNSSEGWYDASHFKLKEGAKVECLFKKGQVVWDVRIGKGKVVCVHEAEVYDTAVEVLFENGETDLFTKDGKMLETDKLRSLYFSEPKIEAATEPVFEPTLKKGEMVVHFNKYSTYYAVGEVDYEDIDCVALVDDDAAMRKSAFDFYRLGEKIKFN